MNKMKTKWMIQAALCGCLSLAACADDDPTTPAGEQPGHGDRPEYTYATVEFRRLVGGSFRGWTSCEAIAGGEIADATQTRTVAGMNWFSP